MTLREQFKEKECLGCAYYTTDAIYSSYCKRNNQTECYIDYLEQLNYKKGKVINILKEWRKNYQALPNSECCEDESCIECKLIKAVDDYEASHD